MLSIGLLELLRECLCTGTFELQLPHGLVGAPFIAGLFIRTLEKELPSFMEYLKEETKLPMEDFLFMQYNTLMYTSGQTFAWFAANGYKLFTK